MKKYLYFLVTLLTIAFIFPTVAQEKATGLSEVKLYLDPGHSLRENMGIHGYSEAEKVLDVAHAIKEYLLAYTDMKEENILMCRTTGAESVSLTQRTDEANAWGADFFYSIHSDAGGNTNTTLYLYGGRRLASDIQAGNYWNLLEKLPEGGKAFGDLLHPALTPLLRVGTRENRNDLDFYRNQSGYSTSRQIPWLHVNRETRMASHLSEAGFHTNAVQNMQFMNAEHKRMQAYAAYQALVRFLSEKYGEGRVEPVQVGIATGFITDPETNSPVNGATITLSREGEENRVYTTDSYESLFKNYTNRPDDLRNGFYWIEGLTPGATYNVKVEAEEFQTFNTQLTIPEEVGATTINGLGVLDVNMVNQSAAVVKRAEAGGANFDYYKDAMPLNRVVSIIFNRVMNTESVENAVDLIVKLPEDSEESEESEKSKLAFSWTTITEMSGYPVTAHVLRIDISKLAFETEYELIIDAGVARTASGDGFEGGGLNGDYLLSFTTEPSTPPTVTSYDPQGEQTYMLRPIVRIEFDKPLDLTSIGEGQIVVTDKNDAPVAGTQNFSTMNNRTVLHYIFNADLNLNETYTVTLNSGIKNTYGDEMKDDFVFTFSPRNRTVSVNTPALPHFNQNTPAPYDSWYRPEQADGSQSFGFVVENTSFAFDNSVLPTAGDNMSFRLRYHWDDKAPNGSNIREHFNGLDGAANPRFTRNNVLQFWLFGDGSNSQVSVVLRSSTPIAGYWHIGATNALGNLNMIKLDWVGWKLVSWDLTNDPSAAWLAGSGSLPNATDLRIAGIRLAYPNSAAERLYEPSAIWLSGLKLVTLGEFEGAFEVRFNAQGGSAVKSVVVTDGETFSAPASPTRAGYFFGGWFKDSEGATAWDFETDAVTETTTLYAKWLPLIASYDPLGDQILPARPIVRIEFREPLNEETIADDQISVYTTDGDQITGVLSYVAVNGKSALHYMFNADLETNVTYNVMLRGGYETANGAVISEDLNFGFTTRRQETNIVATAEHFNDNSTAPWSNWKPTTSSASDGETNNIAISGTNFDYDADVVSDIESPISFRLNYQWGTENPGTARTIRQHHNDAEHADNPLFDRTGNTLQFYLFGDGSGSQVSLSLLNGTESEDGYWVRSPLHTVDWVGWKLISWDLENDENDVVWEGTGEMPETVRFSGIRVVGAAESHTEPSSLWFSNLQVVTFGELEDAFTVTFDSNGGSYVADAYVTVGNTLLQPPSPTNPVEEIGFVGWFIDSELTQAYDFNAPVTGNFILYAKWAGLVDVIFDSTGGSAVATVAVPEGATVAVPADPTRAGFRFDGWFTEAEGGEEWNFIEGIVGEEGLTLFAHWTPVFRVTFHVNGGSAVAPVTVVQGEVFVAPAPPTLFGFDFTGWAKYENWKVVNSATNFRESAPSGDVIAAIPNGTEYTIADKVFVNSYDYGNATININFDPESEPNMRTGWLVITEPGSPAALWSEFVSYGEAWDFDVDELTKDIALFAMWKPISEFVIRFDSNGGSEVEPIILEEGKLPKPDDPILTGHKLLGWFTADDVEWDFDDVVTGNMTLYAKWQKVLAILSYDPQGAQEYSARPIVRLEFNVALDETTISDIVVTDAAGAPVAGVQYYLAVGEKSVLHFLFNNDLTANAIYSVRLEAGLKSADGELELDDAFTFEFRSIQRETTVQKVLNAFDNSVGDWFDTSLGHSGTTRWILQRTNKFAIDNEVLATTDNLGSAWVSYQWNEAYAPGAPDPNYPSDPSPSVPRIRYLSHNTPTAATVKFSKDAIIQYYLFGDGSGNMFRLALRAGGVGTIFTNEPFALDWIGWKLITWDLQKDPVAFWLIDGGDWPDAPDVLNVHAIGIELPATNVSYAEHTIRMSQLQTVSLGAIIGGYTVTFETNGGGIIPPALVLAGEPVSPPADPFIEGNEFGGWFTENGIEWDFLNDVVNQDMTLYAKWLLNYTVTFDPNYEGGVAEEEDFSANSLVVKPADPVREGYRFDGWFTAATDGDEWNFAEDMLTENITLYAYWTILYTVTFDSDGGSLVNPIQVPDGEFTTAPANPTLTGHSFAGWFIGEEQWVFAATNPVTENVTLTAKWTVNSYTFRFRPNYTGATDISISVPYGTLIPAIDDPIREGYQFDGWYKDSNLTDPWDFDVDLMPAGVAGGAVNAYAKWIVPVPKEFTVTFDSQGGSDVDPVIVVEGGKATAPTPPTREGYEFAGWFTDEDGTDEYDFDDVVTDDLTLYAKWTVKEYTVTFDSRGGSPVASATVAHGEKVTSPANPTRDGYDFVGWYKEAAGTNAWNFDNETVTGNLTLYAKWEEIKTGYDLEDALIARMYPNPTTDGIFTIEFGAQGRYIVTITDMAGKVLQRQTVSDQIAEMDISNLADGVYIVLVDNGKKQTVMRIVKQ